MKRVIGLFARGAARKNPPMEKVLDLTKGIEQPYIDEKDLYVERPRTKIRLIKREKLDSENLKDGGRE